jgi:hypothetical protein
MPSIKISKNEMGTRSTNMQYRKNAQELQSRWSLQAQSKTE